MTVKALDDHSSNEVIDAQRFARDRRRRIDLQKATNQVLDELEAVDEQ
jgi:hypothetical protein